jgi:hypothetical protein
MDLLVEQAAQAGRVEAETPLLRPDIGAEVKLPRGMAVHMAIKTSHTETGLRAFTVIGRIEFLLRQRRQQHLKPVKLDWGNNIFE